MLKFNLLIFFYFLHHHEFAKGVEFPVLNFVPDLIEYWGYPFENHFFETNDGYILNFHRIPRPGQPVVYLQHGLFGSSARFTAGPPHQSLAYILSDLNYDVWLGNTRGNTYSRNHSSLDPDLDLEPFWNYEWDLAGQNDIPAAIDYITTNTGQEKIFYLGHSMGSTEFLVTMSEQPEWQDKLYAGFLFAPPAWMGHMNNTLSSIAQFVDEVDALFEALGLWEFLPDNPLTSDIGHNKCDEAHFAENEQLCLGLAAPFFQISPAQLNLTMLPIYFDVYPEGCSYKPLIHYAQLINSPEYFRKMDFGTEGNLEHYGVPDPPSYDLSKITLPTYLYYGDGDSLVSVEDVAILEAALPNVKESYLVPFSGWTHNDFVYAMESPELLYFKIIDALAEILATPETEI